MKKEIFYNELIKVLELKVDSINENTQLFLDSLDTLTIISLTDKHFNKDIDTTQLTYVSSVKNLMEIIGLENFE
jgi:acyl carrier protein